VSWARPRTAQPARRAAAGSSLPNPGWVQLVDPETKKPFWFHKRYRSRRDSPPEASDDGRVGAGLGEPGGKRYVCLFDNIVLRHFFGDLLTGTSSWAMPARFDKLGIPYRPLWEAHSSESGDGMVFTNRVTGEERATLPGDFDGYPTWEDTSSFPAEPPPDLPPDMVTARTYTDMRGFAEKRGGGTSLLGSKNFRKRFFVLDDGIMSYFLDEAVSVHYRRVGRLATPALAASGPELCEEGLGHSLG
jgi:hypothetical protein